jgi:hypothetical protein
MEIKKLKAHVLGSIQTEQHSGHIADGYMDEGDSLFGKDGTNE